MLAMFTLVEDVSPIRPHNSATGCAPMPLSIGGQVNAKR